jgi:uncharacterized damage-inducible protein DinB
MLRAEGDKFARMLEDLPEDVLSRQVASPKGVEPPSKSRLELLMSAKEHEMHYRGQLMLIERLLGIVPHLTRAMQARVAAMQANQGKA